MPQTFTKLATTTTDTTSTAAGTATFFSFPSKPPPPLITFVFILIVCILGFYSIHYPHQQHRYPIPPPRNPETNLHFRRTFIALSSNYTISSYLRAITAHSHVAGTKPSLETIQYVKSQFEQLNFETHTVKYKTLLSYPSHASLLLHFGNGTVLDLPLTEKGIPRNAFQDIVQPYHAYSPSGSAYAKVVFVNYGREEDYIALQAIGVNVSGCVVIARKGNSLPRTGVISIAEAKGALAVLLYADGDSLRGGGVERGKVMEGAGDPRTPGWAAVEGGETLDLEDSEVLKNFPKIPSLPLSFENAQIILGSLADGAVPRFWNYPGRFRGGQVGPDPIMVNLTYQGEKKIAAIHNVFAVIRGLEEPDRYVLLGNHRDAWTYGAIDPNSGTASLLDIARRYALMMRMGWTPRRTIIFCSWDAEEFGMIGSTEWVEQNLVNLGAKAVAYLNVDCAVQGPGFFAAATPQLDSLLIDVIKNVKDPDSEGGSLYDQWTSTNEVFSIQRLSAVDSDFTAFVHHAGIPSADLFYGRDFPVYHTAFDSYDWIVKHADPLFKRHVAVSGVWGLLALHLADDMILPFHYLSYADQLQEYKNMLSTLFDGSLSLDPVTSAIQELHSAAEGVEDEVKKLKDQEAMDAFVVLRIRALNDRLMLVERGFLDADGLHGRKWFKHLVYGPPSNYESKLLFFPGIADAISESAKVSSRDGQALIQHEIWRVARAIQRAASALKGDVS